MKIIDKPLLDIISERAGINPRLRKNYNLHGELTEKVQRLLNAMEPGTEIPVHRHKNTDETYVLLRGSLNVKLYNDNGELINLIRLDPKEEKYGVSIPANQWHTIEVLEKGTVIFEVKEGPYLPISEEDVLPVIN